MPDRVSYLCHDSARFSQLDTNGGTQTAAGVIQISHAELALQLHSIILRITSKMLTKSFSGSRDFSLAMDIGETVAAGIITASSIENATASVIKHSPVVHPVTGETLHPRPSHCLRRHIDGSEELAVRYVHTHVDGYTLGRLILIYPRPLSNLLIQTYDYACSLHEEWTFLLRSRWCKMKGLYIVTRYLSLIFLATDLYLYFSPNENPGKCRVLENIQSGTCTVHSCMHVLPEGYYFSLTGLGTVLVISSEYFFVSRTYVLWNKNRILLAAIVCTSFVSSKSTHNIQASGRCISQIVIVATFGIVFVTDVPAAYATSTIPGITGCYQSPSSYQLFIPFLLLSLFEMGLLILTLIHAIQSWWANQSRLYVLLVNHNISYYACGFLFSVTNVITPLLLQDSYQTILNSVQFIMLAILATRMHLHLWEVNRHPRGSTSALVHIPMS
ncbi:uncharacterized protein F5891DRAFT_1278748, partial [Suillus fuscotomentosus]